MIRSAGGWIFLGMIAAVMPACGQGSPVIASEKARFQIDVIASGLDHPWAMAKLPDGRFLVTERAGRLRVMENDRLLPDSVEGLPPLSALKEGGLLDIALHPRHAENGWIYFAIGKPGARGGTTSILRARLEGNSLVEMETIFDPPEADYTGNPDHFGCRLAFDADERLYFSIGDRGARPDAENPAQDLSRSTGKIHRVNDDGTIPGDNPFVSTPGALPSIWSLGHRNPQGLVFQPSMGVLWSSEHGPRGGDELNIIRRGRNYGWPVVTHGRNHDGSIISRHTSAPGMEDPETQWTPSIATSGIGFYSGDGFPEWKGNLFVCALLFRKLVRIELDEHNKPTHQEDLLQGLGRVRSVYSFDDGDLYVIFDVPGAIVRLHPAP